MSISYFRPRGRFDFSGDSLDIGNPLRWSRQHFLKHLFKRVFTIDEDRLEEFYQRHLAYYLDTYSDGDEKIFFEYFYETIESQLKVLKAKDIYDKNHVRNQTNIGRLKMVMSMLMSFDKWDILRSHQPIIERQEIELYALKEEIVKLKAENEEYKQWDGYIQIRDGQALAVLDIFIQMQELKAPDGGYLLVTQAQNTWAKIISKFFREIDVKNIGQTNEIKMDRLRYYLRGLDANDDKKREHEIPKKHKLFTVSPIKGSKK